MNKYTVVLQYPTFMTDGNVEYYVATLNCKIQYNPTHPTLVRRARAEALEHNKHRGDLKPDDFTHIATIEGHPRIWLND